MADIAARDAPEAETGEWGLASLATWQLKRLSFHSWKFQSRLPRVSLRSRESRALGFFCGWKLIVLLPSFTRGLCQVRPNPKGGCVTCISSKKLAVFTLIFKKIIRCVDFLLRPPLGITKWTCDRLDFVWLAATSAIDRPTYVLS